MKAAVHNAIRQLGEDSQIKAFMLAQEETVTQLCITEYDEARENEKLWNEAHKEGLEKGLAKGRKLEAERMGSLMTKLKSLGRVDDAFRAASDASYREVLYKEFNL